MSYLDTLELIFKLCVLAVAAIAVPLTLIEFAKDIIEAEVPKKLRIAWANRASVRKRVIANTSNTRFSQQ